MESYVEATVMIIKMAVPETVSTSEGIIQSRFTQLSLNMALKRPTDAYPKPKVIANVKILVINAVADFVILELSLSIADTVPLYRDKFTQLS